MSQGNIILRILVPHVMRVVLLYVARLVLHSKVHQLCLLALRLLDGFQGGDLLHLTA